MSKGREGLSLPDTADRSPVRRSQEGSRSKDQQFLQAAQRAYFALLCTPLDSAQRARGQVVLGTLRDYLAEEMHSTSERVQNAYEHAAYCARSSA